MTAAADTAAEKVVSNTLLLSAIGLSNRALTVITQIVIASRFGESIDADAYFATEIIPDLFIVLVGSGLSMAAIPAYTQFRVRAQRDGSNENWEFMSSFIASITAVFLMLCTALFLAAPLVVSMLAPGFEGEGRELTISLFRIMVLTLAFLGPEAGLRALFHSHRSFGTPDVSRFAYNMVLLLVIVFFEDRAGVRAIGWGMVIGAALMISIQFVRATQLGLVHRPSFKLHPEVVRILRKSPAVLVILAWPMILLVIDRAQASGDAAGTLSSLGYASRIVMVPIGVIVLPLVSVLYPTLSELANSEQREELGRRLSEGLRTTMFMVLPACAVLFVARVDVIEALFQRGEFDEAATKRTSAPLVYYIFSVPGLAVVFFLRNVYLAIDRPWSLCWILLWSWVGGAALNVVMKEALEAPGIALATAISASLTACVMVVHLVRRCRVSFSIADVLQPVAVMTALAVGMGGLLAVAYSVGNSLIQSGGVFVRMATLAPLAAIGLALYAAGARAAALDEGEWLFSQARAMRVRAVGR